MFSRKPQPILKISEYEKIKIFNASTNNKEIRLDICISNEGWAISNNPQICLIMPVITDGSSSSICFENGTALHQHNYVRQSKKKLSPILSIFDIKEDCEIIIHSIKPKEGFISPNESINYSLRINFKDMQNFKAGIGLYVISEEWTPRVYGIEINHSNTEGFKPPELLEATDVYIPMINLERHD